MLINILRDSKYLCSTFPFQAGGLIFEGGVFSSEYGIYITVTDWMLQRDPKQELMKAFQLFDDDQTGKISVRNLRRVARELGENMSEDELRAMIDEFDTDNDGESKLNV